MEHYPPAPLAPGFSRERLLQLPRDLLLPRLIEEQMLTLLRQGKLSKWFSGIGQEAIAVGVTAALRPDDVVFPMLRNLGVFTTRGVDLRQLFHQLFGREEGFTRGRDRSFHFGAWKHGIVGMIGHLAAMLPVADGVALASSLRGEDRVTAAFTGDGASSEGDFHEALNLAAQGRPTAPKVPSDTREQRYVDAKSLERVHSPHGRLLESIRALLAY